MDMTIRFELNSELRSLEVGDSLRALDVLRDELGLTGTKEGCGIGECGACTIVVDGLAVNACLMPAAQMDGTAVLTVEGLEALPLGRALQQAFANQGAVQCGFCTPGMLLSAYALLLRERNPSEEMNRPCGEPLPLHRLCSNYCSGPGGGAGSAFLKQTNPQNLADSRGCCLLDTILWVRPPHPSVGALLVSRFPTSLVDSKETESSKPHGCEPCAISTELWTDIGHF